MERRVAVRSSDTSLLLGPGSVVSHCSGLGAAAACFYEWGSAELNFSWRSLPGALRSSHTSLFTSAAASSHESTTDGMYSCRWKDAPRRFLTQVPRHSARQDFV